MLYCVEVELKGLKNTVMEKIVFLLLVGRSKTEIYMTFYPEAIIYAELQSDHKRCLRVWNVERLGLGT